MLLTHIFMPLLLCWLAWSSGQLHTTSSCTRYTYSTYVVVPLMCPVYALIALTSTCSCGAGEAVREGHQRGEREGAHREALQPALAAHEQGGAAHLPTLGGLTLSFIKNEHRYSSYMTPNKNFVSKMYTYKIILQ